MKKHSSAKINLRGLRQKAETFQYSEKDDWILPLAKQAVGDAFREGGGISLEARILPESDHHLLQGRYVFTQKFVCDRCGVEWEGPREGEFELLLLPATDDAPKSSKKAARQGEKGKKKGRRDVEDEPEGWGTSEEEEAMEDVGASIVHNEEVDLSEIFCEQIVLAQPMSVVCREDCEGLCPRCGAELRLGPCGCQESKTDPRWDALKRLVPDRN